MVCRRKARSLIHYLLVFLVFKSCVIKYKVNTCFDDQVLTSRLARGIPIENLLVSCKCSVSVTSLYSINCTTTRSAGTSRRTSTTHTLRARRKKTLWVLFIRIPDSYGRIIILLLALCGDIELNPGPISTKSDVELNPGPKGLVNSLPVSDTDTTTNEKDPSSMTYVELRAALARLGRGNQGSRRELTEKLIDVRMKVKILNRIPFPPVAVVGCIGLCSMCNLHGRKNQLFISCIECSRTFHKSCLKISITQYKIASKTAGWTCWQCSVPQLSDSMFDDSMQSPFPSVMSPLNTSNNRLDSKQSTATTSTGAVNDRSAEKCKFSRSSNNISLLSFNARSLKNVKRQPEISAWITAQNPDILTICETWLTENVNDGEFLPPGYIISRKDRTHKGGGGVLIAARPSLHPIRMTKLETCAEIVWVQVTIANRNILIGSAYRSPNACQTINDDLMLSLKMVQDVQHQFAAVLITGDFNIAVKWNADPPVAENALAESMLSSFYDLFLQQLVKEPTRITATTEHILDLVLCSSPDLVDTVQVIPGVSDHMAVSIELSLKRTAQKSLFKKCLNYSKADWERLTVDLNSKLPLHFEDGCDIESAWTSWKNAFWTCVQDSIPTITIKGKQRVPWINKGLIQALRKRDALFKQWKKTKEEMDWKLYTTFRNKAKNEIRNAHNQYMWKLTNQNSKLMWRYIHSKTASSSPQQFFVNDVLESDQIKLAEAFNNNFHMNFSIPSNASNRTKIYSNPQNQHQVFQDHNNMPTVKFSTYEVFQCLTKLREDAATGPDEIPARILKYCAVSVAPSLSALYNHSIINGALPHDWRVANVIPIFKSGKKEDITNYRPISLTSIICKTMERIISTEIMKYIKAANILNTNQHGFVPGRSCSTLLTKVLDDWQYALEDPKCKQVDAVLLDWSKAFDQISHKKLLDKLSHYGINGPLHNWLEDFLIRRSQRVVYKGAESSFVDVTSGVPQGSVLGPILFNIFMMDLPNCITSDISQFADDCTLYRKITTKHDVVILQNDLNSIITWSAENNMKLNPQKSIKICFTRSRTPFRNDYRINGLVIVTKDQVKLLGVIISSDLKWNKHTDFIRSKAVRQVYFIARNLTNARVKVKRAVYLALVRPQLTYACPAWNPTSAINKLKLERVQSRATKVIAFKSSHQNNSATARRRTLEIPSLEVFRKKADLNFLWGMLHGTTDLNPFDKIQICTRGSQYGRGDSLQPPRAKSSAYQQGFYNRSCKAWNELPLEAREQRSKNIFKSYVTKLFCDHP
jgi:Reverse transcriptase (RNA-dependent DNA polymerase)/Endonuclease-reverse transcriptase/PHD-finger